MDRSHKAREKVAEPVRDYFRHDPKGALSVFVVLDVPQPQIDFSPVDVGTSNIPTIQMPDTEAIDRTVTHVRKSFEELGIKDVVWLENASSAVAVLTEDQIELISKLDEVLEVVANEQLKEQSATN
ncbi:MAG: hypothetical protein AAF497_26705 [Planctomycetota bacterium]